MATTEARLPRHPINWFIRGAVVILAVTGLAKLWSVSAPGKMLLVADPITGLAFGRLLLLVGLAELALAAVCVFGRSPRLKLVLIAWLATNFVVYRLGLWWMGWKKPCGCLGNLTDALHLSPQSVELIIKILLAYLLAGSYALLLWQWRASGPNVKKGSSQTDHQAEGDKDEMAPDAEQQA